MARRGVSIVSDGSVLGTTVHTAAGVDITADLCISRIDWTIDCNQPQPNAVRLTIYADSLDIRSAGALVEVDLAYYGCAPDWVPDYAQLDGRTVLEQIADEKARWRTDPRNPANAAAEPPDDVDPPDDGDEDR